VGSGLEEGSRRWGKSPSIPLFQRGKVVNGLKTAIDHVLGSPAGRISNTPDALSGSSFFRGDGLLVGFCGWFFPIFS
jgi:hypothetical protein